MSECVSIQNNPVILKNLQFHLYLVDRVIGGCVGGYCLIGRRTLAGAEVVFWTTVIQNYYSITV